MRIGLIGIGKMGLLHGGILNAMNDVEICALVDSSKFLLGFAHNLLKIPIYTDYIQMLEQQKPDAVVIATPVFLHVPMALECARRGIPFFLEKPLSLNSQEATPLIAEVEQKNLVTMVGYMMRYSESFAKAKELLDKGVLGNLITFQSTIYVSQLFKTGKGWRYSKQKSGGGVVIGQATHLIDLLQWFMGPLQMVSAHTKHWYSQEVEDFAHAYFFFQNGVAGWMDSTWSMRHHRLLEITIEINGENGNLIVTNDYVKLYLDTPVQDLNSGWTNFMRPDLYKGVEFDVGGTYYTSQDKAFLEAVQSGQSPDSDVQNAYKVQKIVDAIYDSAGKKGSPVSI